MSTLSPSSVSSERQLGHRLEADARDAFVVSEPVNPWGRRHKTRRIEQRATVDRELRARAVAHLEQLAPTAARTEIRLEGQPAASEACEVVWTSAEGAPELPASSQHAILLDGVLEQLEADVATALLAACQEALVPGGRLIVLGTTRARGLRLPGNSALLHDHLVASQDGLTVISHSLGSAQGARRKPTELVLAVKLETAVPDPEDPTP